MGALFAPLRTETAYQQVCLAIEEKILGRTLQPGDPLPTETELAQQFAVNRSTVREALRALESRGLVMRAPGSKRLQVARPAAAAVADGVSRALVLHQITFLQVWEAMMLLEPELAALAAQRRSETALAALEAAAQPLADDPALPAELAVDHTVRFFSLLAEACGNHALEIAAEPLTRLLRPTLSRMIDQVPQARQRIAGAQRQLLEALTRGDAEQARAWMGKHIRDFRRGYELAGIALDARVETTAPDR
ncbi:MAG: FadR family transcriptional regulator [Gammaproteobacteria bacterium]|nr:FadR family transcriptional regulator [Gammaproteobacteria bacterium]TVQ45013.1 MAG: FadR family transcriptional regulator [Gammaproteobacteria bacterium]